MLRRAPPAGPGALGGDAGGTGQLVGGLYGVHLGGAFFGESMFHRETDASKVALVALVDRLRRRSFSLLDIQWVKPHLVQFGAMEIPRAEYLKRLKGAAKTARSRRTFRAADALQRSELARRDAGLGLGSATGLDSVHRVRLAQRERRDRRRRTSSPPRVTI